MCLHKCVCVCSRRKKIICIFLTSTAFFSRPLAAGLQTLYCLCSISLCRELLITTLHLTAWHTLTLTPTLTGTRSTLTHAHTGSPLLPIAILRTINIWLFHLSSGPENTHMQSCRTHKGTEIHKMKIHTYTGDVHICVNTYCDTTLHTSHCFSVTHKHTHTLAALCKCMSTS